MSENKKTMNHKEVRDALLKMQKLGGGMIMPFPFYEIAEARFPDKSLAYHRTITQVFCALCNEYYLINCYEKNPKTRFFVSDDRWEKYHLDSKTRENLIDELIKDGWIFCEDVSLPNNPNLKVRAFEINADRLNLFIRYADEQRDARRANKLPF